MDVCRSAAQLPHDGTVLEVPVLSTLQESYQKWPQVTFRVEAPLVYDITYIQDGYGLQRVQISFSLYNEE